MKGSIEIDLTDLKALVRNAERGVYETENHEVTIKLSEGARTRLRERWEAAEGVPKTEMYVCPYCETRVEAISYEGTIMCRECNEPLRRVE